MACPINSSMKIKTDKPIRQVKDFTILSDWSPLTIATSADPRLMRTTNNKLRITILNTMSFPHYLFL
jgi:hypothetical protein